MDRVPKPRSKTLYTAISFYYKAVTKSTNIRSFTSSRVHMTILITSFSFLFFYFFYFFFVHGRIKDIV